MFGICGKSDISNIVRLVAQDEIDTDQDLRIKLRIWELAPNNCITIKFNDKFTCMDISV